MSSLPLSPEERTAKTAMIPGSSVAQQNVSSRRELRSALIPVHINNIRHPHSTLGAKTDGSGTGIFTGRSLIPFC